MVLAAAPESQMEEVVVTAERRPERLSDVPMSVNAISGEQLTQWRLFSVGDLAKVVPGLTFTPSPYGAPILTIRGIGYFDEAVGSSPAVSVYLDQVPIPFPRAAEGVSLDTQRVEVLKGPQGTLFGQNSTGGAINYVANMPTTQFATGADLSYGRFDEVDADGFVSGSLSDQLTARVALRARHADGWQQSVARDDTLGKADFDSARLILDWKAADTLTWILNANGWVDRSDTQALQFQRYVASAGPNGYPGNAAFPNQAAELLATPPAPANDRSAAWNAGRNLGRDDHFGQVSLRGDLGLGHKIGLTALSAYSALDVSSPTDVDGTPFPVLTLTNHAHTKSLFQELRAANDPDPAQRLHWTTGVNYQHDRVDDVQHVENQGSNSGVGPYRFGPFDNSSLQKIDTAAAFGGLDYQLTRLLTAQTSVRYTHQERVMDGCLVDSGSGQSATALGYLSTVFLGNPHLPGPGDPSYIPPGGCATLDSHTNLPVPDVHKSLREDNLSWRFGLALEPSPGQLLYANVTRGYKGGSFGTVPAVRPEQFDPVVQESVTAYEIGLKMSTSDRAVEISAAAFYYDYRNKQLLAYISDAFFGNLPGLVSVPRSRVIGAESGLRWLPITGLAVSVSGSYVNSRVTSDFATLGPLSSSGFVNVRGSAFPDTPKWNALADVEYRRSLGADWDAFVGANTTYQSPASSTFAAGPEFAIPGHTLVDARVGAEKYDRSLRVELWAHNITNRYYWTHVDHVLDCITRTAGMPLTFGASLSVRF
jgi:outer membrane receptor protein involved in Fe transport